MKILIVNKFLYLNGGSETYITKLGQELERLGHQISYFGMESNDNVVGNKEGLYTTNMDFKTNKLGKVLYPFKIIYSIDAKKKIEQLLFSCEPDVVHINNFNFQLTPSILYGIQKYRKKTKKKVKIVFTAHDSQLVCPNHLMQNPITKKGCIECMEHGLIRCTKNKCIHGSRVKSLLGTVEGILYKRLKTYRFIDEIIAPSQFLKERLETNPYLKNKITVMHNFIDIENTEKIKQLQEHKVENKFSRSVSAASPLQVCETTGFKYVLYLGRYSVEKGIETLLQVCRDLNHIPFVFAGNGLFEEQVNGVKNITNLGFLSGDKLVETIVNAEFIVFPSECYENCSLTVMESVAYGVPVIGSRMGGTPELIEDGKNGILFEAGNVEELKAKIMQLWNKEALVEQYSEQCKNKQYLNAKQYCEILIEQFYQ